MCGLRLPQTSLQQHQRRNGFSTPINYYSRPKTPSNDCEKQNRLLDSRMPALHENGHRHKPASKSSSGQSKLPQLEYPIDPYWQLPEAVSDGESDSPGPSTPDTHCSSDGIHHNCHLISPDAVVKCAKCNTEPQWVFLDEADGSQHIMHMQNLECPCSKPNPRQDTS